MTLFRKVFQNQARPATPEEALDDDALREALEDADAFVLDPVEHAVQPETDLTDAIFNAPAQPELEPEPEHSDLYSPSDDADVYEEPDLYEEVEVGDESEADAEAVTELELDDPFSGPEDVYDDDDTQTLIEEDITAFLDRALAADSEKPDAGAGQMSTDVFQAPAIKKPEQAEIEAVLEEPAAGVDIEMEQVAEDVSEGSASTDVAEFAKAQLAALDGAEPVNDPVEDAGDAMGADLDLSNVESLAPVAAPAAGRAGRRAGRVKTRLLGFNRSEEDSDPFGNTTDTTAAPERNKFPVGWLVVVEGPGVGHSFSIFAGASMLGRGEDQGIRLDFGDNAISRNNHAAIAYDDEENKFYIGHGGKSNIIRRNARPVLSTEELHHADLIRIGETTLRFVALCGSDFQWDKDGGSNAS
ncbi:MAG: FHA domain-containing protein [Roseobacter sp.]